MGGISSFQSQWLNTAVQSQKAGSAYFTNNHILSFGFAQQNGYVDECIAWLFNIFPTYRLSNSGGLSNMKWNEWGLRPPLCTCRLNWARRTSWWWWDEWDDTAFQTQDSKFKPWRSEAEIATSRSRRLPTILNIYEWVGKKHLFLWNLNARAGFEPAISVQEVTQSILKRFSWNFVKTFF